jgi:hypothetical protein
VNYLSHFVIDHHPGSHYYNSALILPDITKRWIKTFKHPEPPLSFSPDQLALLQGCLMHYESDKTFHVSVFFEKYQALVNAHLKTKTFSEDVQRKWFIAHVLTELLIDRKIVGSRPDLVDSFYASLNAIDDRQLAEFLEYYGMTETADFSKFFNHFRSVQYIYYYADNNKFLYSLNRIMMRVGIKELSDQDAATMLEAILEIETLHMTDGTALLNELKQVFNHT